MITNYLTILQESLEKKNGILDKLQEISKKQALLLKSNELEWDKYDACVDEKTALIEELEHIDEGFDTLYQRIAGELKQDRARYSVQIAILQDSIREIMDKSMSIQALESRNKETVELHFKRERSRLGTNRKSARVAYDYYKSSSGADVVAPQFLDKKK